jgi:Na+/H+ antiporter NhaD/arsenite permease-like protein
MPAMAALSTSPWPVLAVFVVVYLGMVLGGLPKLQLDRSGVALLGAIAVIGLGDLSPTQAAQAVHLPTILLLFSFMVVSAQLRLGGFYDAVTRAVARLPLGPAGLMGAVIGLSAALSAVFSNDVVALAMAPVLIEVCQQRRVPPLPYLLGLACASNIGSAATLIGNPQNMLIGSVLSLPFAAYSRQVLPPALASLLLLWAGLAWSMARVGPQGALAHALPEPVAAAKHPPIDRWQNAKGLAVAAALCVIFLATDWPREVAALVGAGLLLLSRKLHSGAVMGLVDWPLLVLFMGLFVVNQALQDTGLAGQALAWAAAQGLDLQQPGTQALLTVGLSNLVSNVPAVMLLLPHVGGASGGTSLALVSTLAGNLLLIGSIANLIVADAAHRAGIALGWREHARVGLPITLCSLALALVWQAWVGS